MLELQMIEDCFAQYQRNILLSCCKGFMVQTDDPWWMSYINRNALTRSTGQRRGVVDRT